MTQIDKAQFDPIPIGEVAKPPFVQLPDPSTLFTRRAGRLRSLAERHELRAYLTFIADLSDLQHSLHAVLPRSELPLAADIAQARQFKMPPLDRSRFVPDAAFDALWDGFLAAVGSIDMPDGARHAMERVKASNTGMQAAMVSAVLNDTIPAAALAEHALVAAVTQVHYARLAAQLDPKALVPIGEGVCPACGGPPVCSMVVGWSGSQNTRFCACSLCGTLWNYPRIKCTLCGSTEGIAFQEVAGGSGAVKAETCDSCGRYVKVLQQHAHRSLDPVADDVATLALDLLLCQSKYRRGGVNPFLLGY
jgi:FdhE protein